MTTGCRCCEEGPLVPLDVDNAPNLSSVAYRIGTFSSFRHTMLHAIAGTPELQVLSTRRSDEFAVTLIELWATVADTLTFYQERYFNEVLLRTARDRTSVAKLADLVDYRLHPGVASLADVAFDLQGEARATIAQGLPLQSVPGADESPQTFETLDDVVGDGRVNRLRVGPAPGSRDPFGRGSTGGMLASDAATPYLLTELAPGDDLVLFHPATKAMTRLTVARIDVDGDRLVLRWEEPLQSDWPRDSLLYESGRTFRLFGHTAPPARMQPATANVPGGIKWTLVSQSDWTYEAPEDQPGDRPTDVVTLDGIYEIPAGTKVLLETASGAEGVFTVASSDEVADAFASLGDTVTRLRLSDDVPALDRRTSFVHELTSEPLAVVGTHYAASLPADTVYVRGRKVDSAAVEIGRTISKDGYEAGAVLELGGLARGRRVIVGDAARSVAARVDGALVTAGEIRFSATDADRVTCALLGLDRAIAGIVSAELDVASLTAETPELVVTAGTSGPRSVRLAGKPSSVADAAAKLEQALQNADPAPPFARARVFAHNDSLFVAPGVEGAAVRFEPSPGDSSSVGELGLSARRARPALLSLPPASPAPYAAGSLNVSIGHLGPLRIDVSATTTLVAFANELEQELRAADDSAAFSDAEVRAAGGRFLVASGDTQAAVQDLLAIALTPAQPATLDARSAELLGNVAGASHGESVRREVLGSGDASRANQRFALKRKPLTFLPSTRPEGIEAALRVFVDRVRWSEVRELFGQPANATVFMIRMRDDGAAEIVFGDGTNGARLPTGRDNVTADYRVGLGLSGRVAAGRLTTALRRPAGLEAVSNPAAAEGGADPEPIDTARANAPRTVRTFGRAVSLLDFEDVVKASGEVAKAQATWIWRRGRRALHLTVAGQLGQRFQAAGLARLAAGLHAVRDPNHVVLIDNHDAVPIRLAAHLRVDDSYVRDEVIQDGVQAIADAFAFDAVQIGRSIFLSDVYALLQRVAGVDSVDIDMLTFKRPSEMSAAEFDEQLEARGVVRSGLGDVEMVQPRLTIFPARPDGSVESGVRPGELATIESPADDAVITASGGLVP